MAWPYVPPETDPNGSPCSWAPAISLIASEDAVQPRTLETPGGVAALVLRVVSF
jgi:hypothetical protein